MAPAAIVKVVGRSIIDSRGNPTVEADVSEFFFGGRRERAAASKKKSVRSTARRGRGGGAAARGVAAHGRPCAISHAVFLFYLLAECSVKKGMPAAVGGSPSEGQGQRSHASAAAFFFLRAPPPANRSPIFYSPLPDTATHKGTFRAAVPSGASTGIYEAVELRDGGDA
jgi:hypothetical protein